MIRLHGPVKKLEESAYWIDKIFENNPSMKEVYPEDSRYILEPFCIEEGELEYFDLSVHPIVRYSFTLGASHKEITGFEITDACIECGACARNCPQQLHFIHKHHFKLMTGIVYIVVYAWSLVQ